MTKIPPIQTAFEFLIAKTELLKQHGFVMSADLGEDTRKFLIIMTSPVANARLELTYPNQGSVELIHIPSGRYLFQRVFENGSSLQINEMLEDLIALAIHADADHNPPQPPITVQFHAWFHLNSRANILPQSPLVTAPGCYAPSDNLIDHPPEYTEVTVRHGVSQAALRLRVQQDGMALISRQAKPDGCIELIAKRKVESESDFAEVYAQAFNLALGSGPTTHVQPQPRIRSKFLRWLMKILYKEW